MTRLASSAISSSTPTSRQAGDLTSRQLFRFPGWARRAGARRWATVGDAIVGVVANPLSGRDIRRLVTQASVFPTAEKANMIQRMLTAFGAVGVHRALLSTDLGGISASVLRALGRRRRARGHGPGRAAGLLAHADRAVRLRDRGQRRLPARLRRRADAARAQAGRRRSLVDRAHPGGAGPGSDWWKRKKLPGSYLALTRSSRP
jgi:hypothetical protein